LHIAHLMALNVEVFSDDLFALPVQLHHVDVAAHRLALPALTAPDGRENAKQHRHEPWRIDVAVGDVAYSRRTAKAERSRSVPCCSPSPCIDLAILASHEELHLPCSEVVTAKRRKPKSSRSVPSCSQDAVSALPHHCTHRSRLARPCQHSGFLVVIVGRRKPPEVGAACLVAQRGGVCLVASLQARLNVAGRCQPSLKKEKVGPMR
jgi:hypothetical protein